MPERQASRRSEGGAGERRRKPSRREYAVVAYAVVAVSALVALRALTDELDFLGIGWMLVLIALPLLPWLLPRLADFAKAVSPYVESLKLGALQLDFRTVAREPIAVPSSGIFAAVPNDVAALSSGTTISAILTSLRDFRRAGAGPVAVIDLRDGRKWRLPNLYFLARLLHLEPVVSQLVLTEARGGVDGYLLGSCRPGELCQRIEQAVPAYRLAAESPGMAAAGDPSDPAHAQSLGTAFTGFLAALGPTTGGDDDPLFGWVTAERVALLLAGTLDPSAVEAVGGTLSEEDVRTVVESPHRYVPATAGGRVTGLVDREAVALAVARAAVAEV